MQRLQSYSFSDDHYTHEMKICNEYESALIETQMYHQGTNTEGIFKKSIDTELDVLETNTCGVYIIIGRCWKPCLTSTFFRQ